MRKLGFALVAAGLLSAASARAASEDPSTVGLNQVLTGAGSTVTYTGAPTPFPSGPGFGQAPRFNRGSSGATNFQSFVDQSPDAITFESSNSVSGSPVTTSSSSTVAIDLHNTTGKSVQFQSTITAAGLGFYLADINNGDCLVSSCSVASGSSFSDLVQNNNNRGPLSSIGGGPLAEVGFNFSVSRLGETTALYSLSGLLTLNSNGVVDATGLGHGADGVSYPATGIYRLDNVNQVASDPGNVGFSWGATDIGFNIGNAVDQTLIYSTSVHSFSGGGCTVFNPSVCLVTYSGFGDPVGRGGGDPALLSFFAAFASDGDGGNSVGGVSFTPTSFRLPTFDADRGVLSFGNSVPEPATWMTMILGFALLGATLRRRRTVAAI